MKKVFFLFLCVVLIFSLSIPCFAATVDGVSTEEDLSQNYNVSPICPWEQISTYGVNPPTEGWNICTQGAYYFSGQAAYSKLYLSKLLYGPYYYSVTVTNRSSTGALTVNPQDGIPVAPFTVAANSTVSDRRFIQKDGTTYFCLSFNAPSNFEGFVAEWYYQ